jgi:small-conductance mechanosensitive channel
MTLTAMTGGMITDILGDAANYTWRISSALCIIVVVATALRAIFATYEYAISKSTKKFACASVWKVHIHSQMAQVLIMLVTFIATLTYVISTKWVEQITSAFVVGIGFGLQGPVVDVAWGFIRRSDSDFTKPGAMLRTSSMGREPVSGQIVNMGLMHVTLCGEKNEVHCVAWGEFRSYDVLR